jgi:hypothetical protein
MHKRGSHAVPIVAPPKEEKSVSKATKKKAELVKEDKVETVELKPDAVDKEQEKVKPEIVKEIESSSSISASAEPSAPPAEEGSPDQAQNLPVANVPVVQGRIIIQADSDTCSDSGNDSEPEVEGGLVERAEEIPQPDPPSFAANLSMEHIMRNLVKRNNFRVIHQTSIFRFRIHNCVNFNTEVLLEVLIIANNL